MCGRYLFTEITAYEIERELGLPSGFFSKMYFGDCRPGMVTGVMQMHREQLSLEDMLWGISTASGRPIINARSETVSEKVMFKEHVRSRRCILPASAFYEWDAQKQKVTFYNTDHRPMYLAGIYLPGPSQKQFVILTREANASMRPVHDRMPLILEKEEVYDWLNRNDLAEALLKKKTAPLENDRVFEQLSLL